MANIPENNGNNPVDNMLDRVIDQSGMEQGEQTGDTDGGEQTSATETTPSQQTNAGEQTAKPGKQDTATRGNNRDPKGQQTARTQQQGRPAETKADAQGNIVDAQGNIIATAGAARRVFDNLRNNAERLTRELSVAQGKLEAYERTHAYVAQPNSKVQSHEIPLAVQLLSAFRTDPAKTIADLVTLARSGGIDVQLDGSSTDMKAIEQMLERKLGEAVGPMRQEHMQRANAQKALGEANREIAELKRAYDRDGRVSANEDALADYINVYARNGAPFRSLREAWLDFSNKALEAGYDLRQDIRAQIAARKNGEGQRTTRTNGGVPTGRGNGAAARAVQPQRGESMPEGTPTEDRVAAAMRAHNLPIQ